MHTTVKNLIDIQTKIEYELSLINNKNLPKIIAVSKTFKINKILPLIEYGHLDFGENKVQEAVDKWTEIKEKKPNIKRMINDTVKIEAIFLLNFNFLTKNITNGLPINETTAAKKIYKIIDFKR